MLVLLLVFPVIVYLVCSKPTPFIFAGLAALAASSAAPAAAATGISAGAATLGAAGIAAGGSAIAGNAQRKSAASGNSGRPRRRKLADMQDTVNEGFDRRGALLAAMSNAAFQWANMRRG